MNYKQQLAAMGEHLAEQEGQPMCMAKRVEELEALLAEARDMMDNQPRGFSRMINRIDAALAGKPADHMEDVRSMVPEGWQLIGYRNISSPNGLRRFMTLKQYSKQTDGIKRWYDPVYSAPVPEGWQLVPVVPTRAMVCAGNAQLAYDCCSGTADEAWPAMLSAAPKPQGGEPSAMQWLPIETAPLDGRRALVFRPLAEKSGDEPIAVKRLIGGNRNSCWGKTVPAGEAPCNPTDGACHVTHWMPLPDEPAHQGGEPCAIEPTSSKPEANP